MFILNASVMYNVKVFSPDEVKGESMESMDRVGLCYLVGDDDKSHINVDMAKIINRGNNRTKNPKTKEKWK